MGNIADALGVSMAALYPPSDTVILAADADDAPDTDLDQDCEALLHAYRRIQNPETRQRLLAFVQEAAA